MLGSPSGSCFARVNSDEKSVSSAVCSCPGVVRGKESVEYDVCERGQSSTGRRGCSAELFARVRGIDERVEIRGIRCFCTFADAAVASQV
jgi:hypothetical protein